MNSICGTIINFSLKKSFTVILQNFNFIEVLYKCKFKKCTTLIQLPPAI